MTGMAIPKLAGGSFSSGPKDDIATADVYKIVSAVNGGKSPITSIQELNASAALGSGLYGIDISESQAADFLSKGVDGLNFDSDLLTSRILGTSSEFRNSIGELTQGMKNNALASTFKDQASKLSCTVGDVNGMVKSANIKEIGALGRFVNEYTGSKVFNGKDSGAIGGLLGSVVQKASQLGVPGVFTSLTSTITDNGIITRMAKSVLPFAISGSDTRLLREITGGPAGKLVNVFSPGFTNNFSRSYQYSGNGAYGSQNVFSDVFKVYENVDSNWDVFDRNDLGGSALNLAMLVGGSRAFQNLVITGVKYWNTESNKPTPNPPVGFKFDPLYAIATAFPETTVSQAIQRDFPKAALLSVYNGRLKRASGSPVGLRQAKPNVVDPRLIGSILGGLFGTR